MSVFIVWIFGPAGGANRRQNRTEVDDPAGGIRKKARPAPLGGSPHDSHRIFVTVP
jgi:hypothetical protein